MIGVHLRNGALLFERAIARLISAGYSPVAAGAIVLVFGFVLNI